MNRMIRQSRLYPLALLLLAGCSGVTESAKDKLYDITGNVIAIDPEKKSVTLDHDDIPGLMKAMTMKLRVEDAKILQGLAPGDRVRGRLKAQSGDYIITELRKD